VSVAETARASRPPLLRAESARLLVDGVVAFPSLTCETKGDRVVVFGDVLPLFRVMSGAVASGTSTGSAAVAGGELEVAGLDVSSEAFCDEVGIAVRDRLLPERWTVSCYLEWSARLAGLTVRDARARASECLAELEVSRFAGRTTNTLVRHERRLVGLAAALLTRPSALVVADPLGELDPHGRAEMLAALDRAARSRGVLVVQPALSLDEVELPLVLGATWVVCLRRGALVLEGEPGRFLGHARAYVVSGVGPIRDLAAELERIGAIVGGRDASLLVTLPDGVAPREVVVLAARLGIGLTGFAPVS
jgi:ABC-type multidrug transport system ATPase subunit